jgi:hypothetical protein
VISNPIESGFWCRYGWNKLFVEKHPRQFCWVAGLRNTALM